MAAIILDKQKTLLIYFMNDAVVHIYRKGISFYYQSRNFAFESKIKKKNVINP